MENLKNFTQRKRTFSKRKKDKTKKRNYRNLIIKLLGLLKDVFDEIYEKRTKFISSSIHLTNFKFLEDFLRIEEQKQMMLEVYDDVSDQQFFYFLVKACSCLDKSRLVNETEDATLVVLKCSHKFLKKEKYKSLLSNNTISLLKKDLYLSLILDPFEVPINFISLLGKNLFIEKLNEDNLIDGLTLHQLEKYLTSKASLEAYSILIENQHLDQYLPQCDDESDNDEKKVNQIKIIIENFMKKAEIYKISLGKGIAAITSFKLRIFINSTIFDWENKQVKKAYFISTFIHEVAHCIIRLIKKGQKTNFFNSTITDEIYGFKEAGKIIDKILFNSNQIFSTLDSQYIINIKNWEQNIKDFQNNYLTVIEERNKQNNENIKNYGKRKYALYLAKEITENRMKCSREFFSHSIDNKEL